MRSDHVLAFIVIAAAAAALATRWLFPRVETVERVVEAPARASPPPFPGLPIVSDWQRAYWRRVGEQLEMAMEEDGAFSKRQVLSPAEWKKEAP